MFLSPIRVPQTRWSPLSKRPKLKSSAFDASGRRHSEALLLRMKRTLVAPLLLLGTLSGQVAHAAKPSDPQKKLLLPEFSYTRGWLGADDAYSVPLAPGRSL